MAPTAARLVILGDSFSCGAGSGAEVAPDDTWGVLVARALRAGWVILAAPGARTCDVLADQLPRALRFRPTHATVLVGLNDVVRPGFDPTRSRRDLMAVVDELRRAAVTVLICRMHDPMVLAHARALLTGLPQGSTAYLDADLREPGKILAGAADLLDFGQPVAVLLIGILQLIPDADDPHAIVARLVEAVPPGSWLAVYHPASDIDQDQVAEAVRRVNARSAGTTTLRTHAEIIRFFGGLRLLEPGLVQVQRWRPGSAAPDDGLQIAAYAGLGRKSGPPALASPG